MMESGLNTSQSKEYNALFLVHAYSRTVTLTEDAMIVIPSDIFQLICAYFHTRFHFEVTPKPTNGTRQAADTLNPDQVDQSQTIIIVVHSESVCVGLAGEDEPMLIIPNIISLLHNNKKQPLIGHELNRNHSSSLDFIPSIRPCERGEITDFNALKQIFYRVFSQFHINTMSASKMNLIRLLIGHPLAFKHREEIAKFVFEELKFTNLYVAHRAVLTLLASGRTTGIVVYSDYESTEIVPVYKGHVIETAAKKINFGRRDVIEYLERQKESTNEDGMELFFTEVDIVSEIWDCITKTDEYHQQIQHAEDVTYYRIEYLWSILLGGINTTYDGLCERLQAEMEQCVKSKQETPMQVLVVAPPERELIAWIGGSILASLSAMQDKWVTLDTYQKEGSSVMANCDIANVLGF